MTIVIRGTRAGWRASLRHACVCEKRTRERGEDDEEDGERASRGGREKAWEQDEGRDDKKGGKEQRREAFILTLGQEKYTVESGEHVRK